MGTEQVAFYPRKPGFASVSLVDFFRPNYAGRVLSARLLCSVAGTGTTGWDIRAGGASVFSPTPTLSSGATASSLFNASTAARIFAADTEISAHITTVSGTPPTNISIQMLVEFDGVPPRRERYTAGENLSALRVVKIESGQAFYADSSDATDRNKVLGITTQAADAGDQISIQTAGEFEDGVWSWTVGTPIFFNSSGALTQTPPSSGFLQAVANPITATKVWIQLQPSILL